MTPTQTLCAKLRVVAKHDTTCDASKSVLSQAADRLSEQEKRIQDLQAKLDNLEIENKRLNTVIEGEIQEWENRFQVK